MRPAKVCRARPRGTAPALDETTGSEPKLVLRLDGDPRAPLVARKKIQSFAAGLDEQMRGNLALLVSELVTNSLRHGGSGPVRVEATIRHGSVRVEVADPGHRFPPDRKPEADAEGGWGLMLVDRMASRWGLVRDDRTRVWFEADLPTSARGDRGWLDVVKDWPEPSRETARSVAVLLGPPERTTEQALVWERDGQCRVVVERTAVDGLD